MLVSPRRPSRPLPLLVCLLALAAGLLAGAGTALAGAPSARAHAAEHGKRDRGRGRSAHAGPRLPRAIAAASRFASDPGSVLTDPISRRYLAELPFGTSSDWIQPWRAYMDTWPASRLIDSLGINFNVTGSQAQDTAQLLQESGFKLARIEIGWNSLSYSDPSTFANEADIDARLQALHAHNLRPLILLNANSGQPAPAKGVKLETLEEAPAGARAVKLSPASAAEVVAGKTGFNDLSFGGGPDILITAVGAEGLATLSRPLLKALPAGPHSGTTLLYAPFGPPKLADGQPNPAFQETLSGWLGYVATVSRKAESIFGPGGYDLEVWNELSFGSQFLDEENYYSPARESGTGSVTQALLEATIAFLRNPANGISPQVGVSDGFASETQLVSGATVPKGTTALSKHLYQNGVYLPSGQIESSSRQLDALGRSQRTASTASAGRGSGFQPSFHAELPEYFLTGIQGESVVRDLAPFTTYVNGVPHGRNVAPPGGTPPQVWMTEYNLEHTNMHSELPSGHSYGEVTPAQEQHIQAEVALRSLVSMIGEGMSREYFYAVTGEGWNLVSEAFISAVNSDPSAYPGAALGGETMASFRRLMAQLQGPGPRRRARRLKLLAIAQRGNQAQFAGDGTAADPALYDRDMLAVMPFQSSPTHFVIPFYVMSENLVTVQKPGEPADAIDRFDMPGQPFRITLGNLPARARPPAVSAYDPIRGVGTPARLVARSGHEAVFEVAATDYPRLLSIQYGAKSRSSR